MKRNLPAIIILLALAGLTFVQFRLLVIGARLEKQRFDQQALVAQRSVRTALNNPGALSDALVARLKNNTLSNSRPDYLIDSLQLFLENKFAEVGITARFSFAVTPRHERKVELASKNFSPENFNFGEYTIPFGDYFSSRLYSEKTLHIDVENLFGYLLKELDYLIIPSVLCLLAILICLAFLISILYKEQRLNEIKNDFINNLTHELKTPAFSISLSVKLAREMLQKKKYDEVDSLLALITKENDKLKSHSEKVLELASLENARYRLKLEPCDMHELIGKMASEHVARVKALGGNINMNLTADRHMVRIDIEHYKNAIQNLLDNAIKYSPEEPVIDIATERQNGFLFIVIADQGLGIPGAHQPHIFDKFYRVPGEQHNVKGFGLGLSYARQIVEAHGGKISVKSREGQGATFTLSLPLQ